MDLSRIVMVASELNLNVSVVKSVDSNWYWIKPSKKVDINTTNIRAEQLVYSVNSTGNEISFHYKLPETQYYLLLGRWTYSVGALINGYADVRDELKKLKHSKGSVVIDFSKHPFDEDFLKESPPGKLKAEADEE